MTTKQELIELEEQGWQALSSDKEAAQEFYRELLTDEAIMIFPGGLLIIGKEKILKSISAQPWQAFHLEETRLVSLSDQAGVIVYRVTARRAESEPYVALISSAYVRRQGRWQLALHQQTPV